MPTKKKPAKPSAKANSSKKAAPVQRAKAEPADDLPEGFADDIEDALAEPLEDMSGIFQVTGELAQKWRREKTGTHHLRPFVRSDTQLNKPKR